MKSPEAEATLAQTLRKVIRGLKDLRSSQSRISVTEMVRLTSLEDECRVAISNYDQKPHLKEK